MVEDGSVARHRLLVPSQPQQKIRHEMGPFPEIMSNAVALFNFASLLRDAPAAHKQGRRCRKSKNGGTFPYAAADRSTSPNISATTAKAAIMRWRGRH
jgi:hypothetical protein